MQAITKKKEREKKEWQGLRKQKEQPMYVSIVPFMLQRIWLH